MFSSRSTDSYYSAPHSAPASTNKRRNDTSQGTSGPNASRQRTQPPPPAEQAFITSQPRDTDDSYYMKWYNYGPPRTQMVSDKYVSTLAERLATLYGYHRDQQQAFQNTYNRIRISLLMNHIDLLASATRVIITDSQIGTNSCIDHFHDDTVVIVLSGANVFILRGAMKLIKSEYALRANLFILQGGTNDFKRLFDEHPDRNQPSRMRINPSEMHRVAQAALNIMTEPQITRTKAIWTLIPPHGSSQYGYAMRTFSEVLHKEARNTYASHINKYHHIVDAET